MSNIGNVFNTAFAPLVDIVGNIINWLQDISGRLANGFQGIIDGVINLPNLLLDGLKALFVPDNEKQRANAEMVKSAFDNKFLFIENFKTAINNLNATPTELAIPIKFGSYERNLSLAWYEPHRAKIKSGLSTIFYVGTTLAIFGMVSGAFGLGIGKYVSNGVQADHGKGGKNQ